MGRSLDEFYAGHPEMSPRAPHPELRQAADWWAGGPSGGWSQVQASMGPQVANWYEGAPDFDPAAVPAYRQMARETGRQFEFLTGSRGLGVDVSVSSKDPYSTPGEMHADLERGRLSVLGTAQTGGHPVFSNEENDMFRAVHDAFGHAATGRGFDRHGEEAAWLSHSRMYPVGARRAMTTETRGQNSALNFGSTPGIFAPQKIIEAPAPFTFIGRRSRLFGPQFGVT